VVAFLGISFFNRDLLFDVLVLILKLDLVFFNCSLFLVFLYCLHFLNLDISEGHVSFSNGGSALASSEATKGFDIVEKDYLFLLLDLSKV